MIGIKCIASYIPESVLDNVQQAQDFGETKEFIANKIGALKLPIKKLDQETSDLAVEAIKKLLDKSVGLCIENIDALVLVTQNGDGEGLPHTSAIVQKKLGLEKSIAAFDISLGCSGFVYGLHVLKGFMESAGLKNGILVTADPYSKVVDSKDKNTSLLFGDAATATWLGESPGWSIGPALFGTDGEGEEALKKNNSVLYMNGRHVFDFASRNVAPHIKALLNSENLKEENIDAFCIHQGSYAIIDAISRRFKNNKEKFFRDMNETGNTVSSSIPLLLEKHVMDTPMDKVVISGFGVGFSWATCLIIRNDQYAQLNKR